jgi:tartrate dehydrogenase/decarboxylase/D-malate dehydrogenase
MTLNNRTYTIAVIPGDGIGKEVVPEGLRVLEAAAARYGFSLKLESHDFSSCEYYRRHGQMMPDDWQDRLIGSDAIFFGAVGWPAEVPDHVSLWGALLQIRKRFDQYVNLRPVRLFEGTEREIVLQDTVMTRQGVDRILRFAFETARARPRRHLTSATKSNGLAISMPYWDERFAEMATNYPDVSIDKQHIDILAANFVLKPDSFDVVVGSNLFGDILSDLAPACTGTIGIAPSGNINPERIFPWLFEPGLGSAPDSAGEGVANPVGQIWAGAMMLEHLGEPDAAAAIVMAIERSLAHPATRTRDLKGNGTTVSAGNAIAEFIA